ncbi:MAG: histidinol dehydrogenase [Thermodesulfobacteriota bacterium]|nr:histidinol dehydrogenase [Thermodesulfobacteriota bacterium]
MKILHTEDKDFLVHLEKILKRAESPSQTVEGTVRTILDDVRDQGDTAVICYSEKFDKWKMSSSMLKVRDEEIEKAFDLVDGRDIEVLKLAADRIEKFHRSQVQNSWIITEEEGTILGQMIRPMERIGIYVPGGKASYPSSVLMAALPAKVAGVQEIIMVTPAMDGTINPHVLIAANLAGVDSIFKVGGAQAIAALAYGTETIPRVDKIVGPGNIYVACAKRMVFGDVDIDMIAGPSEVLIISDGTGSPECIACDLLSQAEHDEMAASILITNSQAFAHKVNNELEKELESLERKTIAQYAIQNNSTIIITRNITESIDLANKIAPEHLELAVDRPFEILSQIRNAGAIFLGHTSPEAVGDYLAGPNHILPTGGTARFSSPLGVDDFIKKSSIISFSRNALSGIGPHIIRIAELEGLEAHALSVKKRMIQDDN